MAKIPEFKFDFEAIEGQELTEAVFTLFGQLEAHYNKHIKPAPILFGGKRISAPAPTPPAETKTEPPKPRPAGLDTETVTADTVQLKDFQIRVSAAGDRKMIVGFAKDNTPINDLLLPGYDEEPYGPVVQGETGRYNLKISK